MYYNAEYSAVKKTTLFFYSYKFDHFSIFILFLIAEILKSGSPAPFF